MVISLIVISFVARCKLTSEMGITYYFIVYVLVLVKPCMLLLTLFIIYLFIYLLMFC